MADSDRLRIAVFIDFDNIEIGVKSTLGASFDAGLVLEALKERGEVVSKTAYSDWQRAGGYSRMLTQHAIRMVQRNMTPGGDKNGADINLALDALEMAFTHPHINAFVIVGGDSDFISLVEKLKQYDKKVFIVGGRQFTSGIMQRNCHEFMAYENLLGASAPQHTSGRRQDGRGSVRVERAPIEQAMPLVTRALKVLQEREVSPQLGLLKSTLLQLDSTFSERSYGAGSFRDFIAKLEKFGIVTVQQGKGGLLVSPVEGAAAPATETPMPAGDEGEAAANGHAADQPSTQDRSPSPSANGAAPDIIGTAADGLREFRQLLTSAHVRRWPMYLRNVKQIMRQTNPAFDERAYGFGNLTDLLRAAGREGIVRVDRDRQGVIRVFQGNIAPAPAADGVVESEELAGNDAGDNQIEAEDVTVAAAASEIGVPVSVIEDDGVETSMAKVASPIFDEEDGDNIGNVAPGAESKKPARARGGRSRTPRAASAAPERQPRARRPRKVR